MSKLTADEKAFIREMVERRRPEIEAAANYTVAEDVSLTDAALQHFKDYLRKIEANYLNGGGWALGRVEYDIVHLKDLQRRNRAKLIRECGE